MKLSWQLQTPIDSVIFDCDGTLSTIEGIDELAKLNGVGDIVKSLTSEAMGTTGLNASLYQKRLELVYPTATQVSTLAQQYYAHRVPHIEAIIQLLNRLNKSVYLVSAGLSPAVSAFGDMLQIPRDNIFAVDIAFDRDGRYLDFERSSPLVQHDGKRQVVRNIKAQHQHILYVGDGMNDYAVYDMVTRFVGYGGAYYRENIAARCQFYITGASLLTLLPLALTHHEYQCLAPIDQSLYQQGVARIHYDLAIT